MILPLVVIILSLQFAAGVLHCPRTVHNFEAQPPPDNFMDFDADNEASTKRNGAADYLFRSLLRDEPLNVHEPERGRTYAFFAFKPGTPLENFCNGGAHVYLILTVWIAENQLSSVVFDLGIREHYNAGMLKEGGESSYCQNDKHIYSAVFAHAEDLKDGRALAWMKKSYTFQALGKVGWDEEYPTIVDMVEQQGAEYFTGFFRSKYNYVLNNCGQFVEAMADFLGAEYHINTVICPAPIKRDPDDGQQGDVLAS